MKNNRKEFIIFGVVILILIICIVFSRMNSNKPKYDKSKIKLNFDQVTEQVESEDNSDEQSEETNSESTQSDTVTTQPAEDNQQPVNTEEPTESVDTTEQVDSTESEGYVKDDGDTNLPSTISSMSDNDFRDFVYQASSNRLDSEILDAYCSKDFIAKYPDLANGTMKTFAYAEFPSERSLDKENKCIKVNIDGVEYTIYYELTADGLLNDVYLK